MTPTAAEVIDPTCQLQDAPEFWRYTPCNGDKEHRDQLNAIRSTLEQIEGGTPNVIDV